MSQEVIKLAILCFPFLQRAPEDGIKTIMLHFVLQTNSGGAVNSLLVQFKHAPAFFNLEA